MSLSLSDRMCSTNEGDILAMFTPLQEKMVSLGVSFSLRMPGNGAAESVAEKNDVHFGGWLFLWDRN